jgi:hypothetical protein
VDEERCHVTLRKFIITLLNIHFLSEVMFVYADQSYFPPKTTSILIFEIGIHSMCYYVFQSLTVFLNIIIFTKFT